MKILNNKPLKEYINYKLGGITPVLYIVEEISDLYKIPDEDLKKAYVLGGGTNLIISDEGVTEPVIKIEIKNFKIENRILEVGAGMDLKKITKETTYSGYEGLNNVSGIPGSVGGAILMNASAAHGAISDNLIMVKVFDKDNKKELSFRKKDCNFGFRQSIFQNKNWIIIEAYFLLKEGDKENLIAGYEKVTKHRERTYPTVFPSAGCWFKRGWGGNDIIRKIGMVGVWENGAVTSPMFPSFILNVNARAKDVYSLVKKIQAKAKEIGEELPCEIVMWGKF